MVSGTYCDLKFKNNQLTPIYIRMNVNYDSVTCSIYGAGDGYNYSFVSQVVQSISPPTTLCEGEQGRVFYEGKEGIISNGYLVKQKGDFSQKLLVRRDSYAPVARRVGGKTNNETILP
jgi:vancomycin resistance protein YoaR